MTAALDARTSLADLAHLDAGDVDAIALVGASAMQSGRYALAIKVFDGLAALEPAVAAHRVRLAAAHHASGDADAALTHLDAALAETAALDDVMRVHALLLRAEIRARTDRASAANDLGEARALASRSADAKRALEGST